MIFPAINLHIYSGFSMAMFVITNWNRFQPDWHTDPGDRWISGLETVSQVCSFYFLLAPSAQRVGFFLRWNCGDTLWDWVSYNRAVRTLSLFDSCWTYTHVTHIVYISQELLSIISFALLPHLKVESEYHHDIMSLIMIIWIYIYILYIYIYMKYII